MTKYNDLSGNNLAGVVLGETVGDKVGPDTAANSLPVTMATDQPAIQSGGVFTTPTHAVLTNGQSSAIQLGIDGSVRSLLVGQTVTAADAVGNTTILFAMTAGTSTAAARPLGVCNWGFNGTSWDRQRGDAVGLSVTSGLSTTFWNYAPPVNGIVNSAVAVTAKTAAGASVRNYIKSLQLSWDTLGAVTEFAIRDGAGGTVLFRHKLPTATGMINIAFDPPLRGTANTLTEIITLTAVTGGVFANLQGYTGA